MKKRSPPSECSLIQFDKIGQVQRAITRPGIPESREREGGGEGGSE